MKSVRTFTTLRNTCESLLKQSNLKAASTLSFTILLYPLLLTNAQASTDSNENQTLVMEEHVITGTRTPKLLVDSPVKVQVIGRDEIRLKNARNLREAIEDVPGIVLRKIHGRSGYEVSMQGVDAKRVLVLIDGDRVSQSSNGISDLTQVGISNIEQIEIVKGATSALYGSNAIGGVINVITRTPDAQFSYHLKGDLGSHFARNLGENETGISSGSSSGNIQIRDKKWDASLSYDLRKTEGFELDPTNWEHEGDDKSKFNGIVSLGYKPDSSQKVLFSSEYYTEDVTSKFYGSGPNRSIYKKSEEGDRQTYKLGYDLLGNDLGVLKVRYFYEELNDVTTQDIVTSSSLEQKRRGLSKNQKLTFQWDSHVEGGSLRTIGLELTPEEGEQKKWTTDSNGDLTLTQEVPRVDALRKEFYFQDDFFVGENLEILPGFRFQHDSDFGQYLTPKINGRYELDQTENASSHLRFGVGRGYRVPSLKERHFRFDHSQHGYKVHGNPDLTPEYSTSFQLGWVYSFQDSVLLDVNLFRNHLQDFIETLPSHVEANGVVVYEYGNIAKARTQGLELITQLKLDESLKFNAGYTLQKAIDRESGNWLPKIPRHMLKTSFTYKPYGDNLSLHATANWEGKSYYDNTRESLSGAHSTFDLKANYQLKTGLSVYAGIDNITDTQKNFDDHYDLRPSEGRYAYIGISLDKQ